MSELYTREEIDEVRKNFLLMVAADGPKDEREEVIKLLVESILEHLDTMTVQEGEKVGNILLTLANKLDALYDAEEGITNE